ncbi:helicase-exonuclease AddAB subunit AddB [Metabacillus iocasae]|uniref:ATP-dependent helicase/deoxyribonuclease subunit B n=1 Tax=Priestia iocasae TaxID=2291674 RepID=A0ABS2QT48_9BACI|nr:helicase-exonuclease AddAB subunit AddB [Metabacillus iocasae]MBM7702643.1 ATP-dependent helicase/nuclease subunit B [Metabacillus iocasae]
MTLQFIVGRSGSGKTNRCLNEIRSKLKEAPLGDPIIYIVPEQMTFQSEYELVSTPELNGMIRAQVYSFTRLAWRVLQEVGGMSRYHLDQTGVNMLIRRIIEHKKEELKIFSKAAEKTGFIDQLEQMITEFKRYCLEAETLEEKRQQLLEDNEQVLADKLYDLQLIYNELQKQLIGKYVDSEDYLHLLAEKIPASPYLSKATIYVDGFHSFTPQELDILSQLMKVCPSMTIALTADKPHEDFIPNELHMFRQTSETYRILATLANENGVEITDHHVLEGQKRHEGAPALAHLERFFDDRPTVPFNEPTTDVKLMPAVNRRAEVEGIAREISTLVRDKGYRYRDIALVVRNAPDYHDLLETVFRDYEIPYFIDQKRAMFHHPLVELIRSSLEIITSQWRYETVFRAVKTDLLFPLDSNLHTYREDMDLLENYVLAYGVQGSKWTKEERWTYRRYRSLDDSDLGKTDEEIEYENKINDLRALIVGPLKRLHQALKQAKTGRQKGEALYTFLTDLQIPKKIEVLRNRAEEEGKPQQAREHEQVWKSVLHLLDQFVEMMGDENISISMFMNVMDTGLDSMKFGLVPPALDQVLVASFERSRFSNIKTTFVLGVNDGIIPAKIQGDGILSEQEREHLLEAGVSLAPTSRTKLFDESFLIYLAFVSPSEALCISYPLANEEGKTLLPSVMINRMKEMFPLVEETLLMTEPAELDQKEQLKFVTNPLTTIAHLAGQLQAWKRHYAMDNSWWDVYNFYVSSPEWKNYSEKVLSSLFYKNEAKPLTKDTSSRLYGKHLKASVSRMEKFQGCPFSHFASHGLKLKERKVFRLAAPDIGELFHAALKMISDELRAEKREWSHLSKKDCQQLSSSAVNELAPKLQNEILLSSNRHHYLKHKLQQIIERASIVLSEHAKASGFAPVGLELGFGTGAELPPIQFQLDNGYTMELVGRIDRVDKAESSKGLLLRIIDYKSSDKALNLVEVYYGLALQMLAYLDVVVTYSEELLQDNRQTLPAGVLYFHVHNPMISTTKALSIDQIEDELFKRFKMKGLLLGDEETVRLMDQTLEVGHSKVVSAGLKKTGDFYSNSSIASEEEFTHLRNYVRKKIVGVGTDITNGAIDISPYKLKDKTPCTFCEYRSVCQFDESMDTNEYRQLKVEKEELILEKMKEEGVNHD